MPERVESWQWFTVISLWLVRKNRIHCTHDLLEIHTLGHWLHVVVVNLRACGLQTSHEFNFPISGKERAGDS